MSEENIVKPIITLLENFNKESEVIFLNFAESLPVLLTELDEDVSPWIGKRDELFNTAVSALYSIRDFLNLSHQEDLYLFSRTHANFDLTLETDTTLPALLKREKALNVLLRRAEREFVALFTLSEVFYDNEKYGFEKHIEEVLEYMRTLDSRMTTIAEAANTVSRPILLAMEEVQHQDIMRQSIQHAVMALDEYDSEEGLGDEELERVTFKIDLLKLTDVVIKEVENIGMAAREGFIEQIRQIEEILNEMEEQKAMLKEEVRIKEADYDIDERFKEAKLDLAEFNQLYIRYVDKRTKIIKAHRSVLKKAQRFLDEAGDNEEELAAMDIIRKVVAIEIQTVHDTAEDALDDHSDYVDIKENLAASLETLKALYGEMHAIIAETALYTDNFLKFFNEVKQETGRLDEVLALLAKSRSETEALVQRFEEEKQKLLTERGLSEWELKSDRIAALTSRFTILSHKRAAGEIVGFDVEQGVDNGEIILF
jgi:hypothetical protein